MSNAINRLKDTGYQRLDLCRSSIEEQDPVRGTSLSLLGGKKNSPANSYVLGQIVVSIASRGMEERSSIEPGTESRHHRPPNTQVVDARSILPPSNENELPEGWEARVVNGRIQYINHYTR